MIRLKRVLLFLLALVLLVVMSLAVPLMAHATDGGTITVESLLGVSLVDAALLVGVVVALAAFAVDMLKIDTLAEGWRRTAKLAVVLCVGVAVMAVVRPDSYVFPGVMIATAAAGYYKLSELSRSSPEG